MNKKDDVLNDIELFRSIQFISILSKIDARLKGYDKEESDNEEKGSSERVQQL